MQCSMPPGPALSGCKGDNKATRSWQFLKKGYNNYLRPLLSLLRYFPLPPYERFAYLIFLGLPTVAHNCHGKTKNLTAKTKYPRQNRKPHGKNKIPHCKTKNLTAKTKTSRQNRNLTAKTKTSRQKQNTSRQNQNPHSKTKDLTAKPNTSQQKPNTSWQKQILTAKPKLLCFCCEVFVFAMRFLVLPWCFCFCREVFGFAMTVVSHHIHQSICYQIVEWKWNFKKHITYESSPFPIK